jgi:hypothetical protein
MCLFATAAWDHLHYLLYVANASLLVLCWVPPILRTSAKVALTAGFVFLLILSIAYERKHLDDVVNAQLAFGGLAILVLVGVSITVVVRRNRPYADGPDQG